MGLARVLGLKIIKDTSLVLLCLQASVPSSLQGRRVPLQVERPTLRISWAHRMCCNYSTAWVCVTANTQAWKLCCRGRREVCWNQLPPVLALKVDSVIGVLAGAVKNSAVLEHSLPSHLKCQRYPPATVPLLPHLKKMSAEVWPLPRTNHPPWCTASCMHACSRRSCHHTCLSHGAEEKTS